MEGKFEVAERASAKVVDLIACGVSASDGLYGCTQEVT